MGTFAWSGTSSRSGTGDLARTPLTIFASRLSAWMATPPLAARPCFVGSNLTPTDGGQRSPSPRYFLTIPWFCTAEDFRTEAEGRGWRGRDALATAGGTPALR
jgi:hypothetical protein